MFSLIKHLRVAISSHKYFSVTGTRCDVENMVLGNVNCAKSSEAFAMLRNATAAKWVVAPDLALTSARSSHAMMTVPQSFKSTCKPK